MVEWGALDHILVGTSIQCVSASRTTSLRFTANGLAACSFATTRRRTSRVGGRARGNAGRLSVYCLVAVIEWGEQLHVDVHPVLVKVPVI